MVGQAREGRFFSRHSRRNIASISTVMAKTLCGVRAAPACAPPIGRPSCIKPKGELSHDQRGRRANEMLARTAL